MNLSDDILREIALKLDTQSIENLSSSSQSLSLQLQRLTTNEFWYTKFVEYTEPLINKQVSWAQQLSWKEALSSAISSTVEGEIDIQAFLPYAVTSLAYVSLAEDMFGEIDWSVSPKIIVQFGSVEVIEALINKIPGWQSDIRLYSRLATEADNLQVSIFFGGLRGLRDDGILLAARCHTTRILKYCREVGLLTSKRALKILRATSNVTVESLAVILPLIPSGPEKIEALYGMAHDLIQDNQDMSEDPVVLKLLLSTLHSEGATKELQELLESAVQFVPELVPDMLKFVTPNSKSILEAIDTDDDELIELLISHLPTSVERTLVRAILREGLKGIELLDRIREEEPDESAIAARVVLGDEGEGTGNSLLQAVFTALLYPEMNKEEILDGISWTEDERDLAEGLLIKALDD